MKAIVQLGRRDGARSAVAAAEAAAAAAPTPHLTFMLGGEVFAMSILSIKEIIVYGAPTQLPLMPVYVRGVINLRGALMPLLDLQARFGRPAGPVTKRTCIVIVEIGSGEERRVVGVLADAVNEVLEIPDSEIEPPPVFGAPIRTGFITGIGKVRGKFVTLLDANNLLALDDLAVLSTSQETLAVSTV